MNRRQCLDLNQAVFLIEIILAQTIMKQLCHVGFHYRRYEVYNNTTAK